MALAPPHSIPSTSTFSFKAPLDITPQPADPSLEPPASDSGALSPSQKPRRVSLALPSSPRLVPAWNFRDDTSVLYRRWKVRRIDTTPDDDGGDEEDDVDGEDKGDGAAPSAAPEKKPRRKWSPEETQMLIDGCNKHGVGNWKSILSDTSFSFSNRSPVDLKDRFRTYFPEAYRSHYPNARTHLPSSLTRATSPSHAGSSSVSAAASASKPSRSTHPDGTPLFPMPSPAHPKRRPFTTEEDSALLAGFRKHGAAWATIVKEASVFGLTGRRSMDLRDRFRNAWPEEYERAGYKARSRVGKKPKEKEKEKEGTLKGEDSEEVRGRRGRVGRAKTDEGLLGRAGASASVCDDLANAGGPVRRRRRAHTSQGFKTMSMPPSVVGSDDEGEGGDGPVSDFGFGFGGASNTSGFTFKFTAGKGEETALVGGMQHLDMAPDESMPDVAPTAPTQEISGPSLPAPPPHAPGRIQTHVIQRRQEELARGINSSGGPTIGRSAWGTQDWFSANPRLDSSTAFSPAPGGSTSIAHSPPLSNSASYPAGPQSPGHDANDFFELTHGVMERYDLEPAALSLTQHLSHIHHHHHHAAPGNGGLPPHAFSSPALSFHSASLSYDTPHSEMGTNDNDPFDEDSSAFSIAESEPGGVASWAGMGGGGGFRGFTHHSNTAGDLIFGARTHQPIWSGVDTWGARGRGLAGIAEARGGKHSEEETDAEVEAGAAAAAEDDKALGLFSLDDFVNLPHDPPDAEMDAASPGADGAGAGEMQLEPPATPLLRAAPAPVRMVHVHHHHHHHHHYAPVAPARSVSVPPSETPEEGLPSGLSLMSAPTTPALAAASPLPPPSSFALDPALLGFNSGAAGRVGTNALHSALMPPPTNAHGDAIYNLPFLDLHYFGGGGAGAGAGLWDVSQPDGRRGGEALDLARSASMGATYPLASPPSLPATSGLPGPVPPVWTAMGIPASLRQHIPGRNPLLRRASGGVPTSTGATVASMSRIGAAGASGGGSGGGSSRSGNHTRGQSAVVRPQDLVISPESALKGKRKRASWDGGGW
ncbi:hypothetical protein GGX14DRAFT_558234 [Mycena pura]|uniref:Uncharacterized protein n=1 Tax=Mycena pura TaxID=153505 RepID=A0AAD6VT80_9AGAR|nr:hypothetical protein GGX14DRAFT_558234 [Mycena pura]